MTENINFDIYQTLHSVSRNMHHLAHYISNQQGEMQDLGRTLNFIADNEACTVKDLADYYGIKSSSATVKVGKLVDQGYLIKTRSTDDLRAFNLSLTSEGTIKKNQINKNTEGIVEDIFDDLSDNQKAVFLDELKQINQRLINKRGSEKAK
ncbi:MarR family transcriptional regulator [Vagococcus fluvialis]|uniref:MarR family winged helix-turn-helix transcriptional regulator n=1 Tax=Vagococcus fluvialis TaxID=2738 RepID=UPI001A8E2A03|nr:MarR family transcriptional regulator [Vagococcus fluvialis]MBO0428541.1 MarR family transcriptional regulator [Vagococcus fluvialis]